MAEYPKAAYIIVYLFSPTIHPNFRPARALCLLVVKCAVTGIHPPVGEMGNRQQPFV